MYEKQGETDVAKARKLHVFVPHLCVWLARDNFHGEGPKLR